MRAITPLGISNAHGIKTDMTFKLVLLRTGQFFLSLVFLALIVAFVGLLVKSVYMLFMLGFNAL